MWKCTNEQCAENGKLIDIDTSKFAYIPRSERDLRTRCGVCGEKMSFEMPQFNEDNLPKIGKFNSLSDADKKKVIKKRYDKAFKKEGGKELINHKREQRVNLMRGGK